MTEYIRDVMTTNPETLPESTTVREAAETMRANDIGDVVIVDDNGAISGILTDRDIVVRSDAEGNDPRAVKVGDIATRSVEALTPDQSLHDAARFMREHDVRRVPVVQDGRPVGIVSLGDLAIEMDTDSALADISSEPSNN
jgi:CBS domain-containing protein